MARSREANILSRHQTLQETALRGPPVFRRSGGNCVRVLDPV